MTTFFRENWFWRGTQSAIFYYASCAPILDYKYKRRRRNEAARAEKNRAEVINTQPGTIRQPGAFQTNEDWVEEILTGPGPPKGWKKDPIVHKLTSREREEIKKRGDQLDGPPGHDGDHSAQEVSAAYKLERETSGSAAHSQPTISIALPTNEAFLTSDDAIVTENVSQAATTSTETDEQRRPPTTRPRLSMERRLSSAVDNLRGTFRSTIHLEGWNWTRYNREDEILSGLNQKMTRMWDKATNFSSTSHGDGDEKPSSSSRGRKRADTLESEQYDYQKYVRNPEINDLHPPVVSRLPSSRDDAAWMLLPAPSAAVMEGKCRPQDEPALRWPLARIGRSAREWEELRRLRDTIECRTIPESDAATESTPDLSDSFSENNSSEEDLDWRPALLKRHSAPVAGWLPIKTAHTNYLHVAANREV